MEYQSLSSNKNTCPIFSIVFIDSTLINLILLLFIQLILNRFWRRRTTITERNYARLGLP